MKRKVLAAAVLASTVSATASAALIINPAPTPAPDQIGDFNNPGHDSKEDNDVVIREYGNGTLIDGWFGSQLSVDRDTALRIEVLGGESGYVNSFTATTGTDSLTIIEQGFNNAGAKFNLFGVTAGLINFKFDVTNTGMSVENGSNPGADDPHVPNFFLGWDPNMAGAVIVALDDGGANPDDDNHDDFVLRISEVPEPSTVALFGLGLVGAGLAARRRKS